MIQNFARKGKTRIENTLSKVIFLVAVSAVSAVSADEMALQRCVWACLSKFGPNTSPAYHSCVQRQCVAGSGSGNSSPAKPSKFWTSGTQSGGRIAYAGVDNADGTLGFYYVCERGGRSELVLAGLDGPGTSMTLVVGGKGYQFFFGRAAGGWHSAPVASDAAVMAALGRGNQVVVRDGTGQRVMELALSGSSQAISGALNRCQ